MQMVKNYDFSWKVLSLDLVTTSEICLDHYPKEHMC